MTLAVATMLSFICLATPCTEIAKHYGDNPIVMMSDKVDREPSIKRRAVQAEPAAAPVKAKRKAGKRDRCGSKTAHWYKTASKYRRYRCR
jgi:hypothetical protein